MIFSPFIKIFLAFFPDLKNLPNRIRGIGPFLLNLREYKKTAGKIDQSIPKWKNAYPQLDDRYKESGSLPGHYFFQDLWAAKLVYQSNERIHFDVGSSVEGFIAHIAVFCNVKIIDIRPQSLKIENVEFIQGDVTNLNFPDNSVRSLSCLHAAEHIGLGRYGDKIDPLGTKRAAEELQRVLAKNASLFFSVPIGKERICFNAHRVFAPKTILQYFNNLSLQSFSVVDDNGEYIEKAEMDKYTEADYSCGLFHFIKK